MPRILTCPHGHRWESPAPPNGGTTILRTLCPICGVSLEVIGEAEEVSGETTEHTPVPPAPPSSAETTDGDSERWSYVPPVDVPKEPSHSDQGVTTGDTTPTGAPARKIGAIAGYEVLAELGRGGMGVVYKARQIKANRLVALKMILAGSHASPHQVRRFLTEAEAVARLQHRNVVQIYEVGEQDELPFFSLEFVSGGTLAEKLADAPLSPRKAAELTAQLAQGVEAAHSSHIIHRDLKPANILLTEDGTPKITDFGLARKLDMPEGYTATGVVMGTPSYMAPEQAEGRTHEVGPAADIYSLGAIFYEAMIGRPPFKGATMVDTLVQVRSLEPVAPRTLQPNLPRDLETICLKCLHKEPQRRYASAGALADDLGRWLRGEPILARPTPLWEVAWKAVKRRPGLSAMFALVIGITLLGISLVTWQWQRAETERVKAEQLAAAEAAAKEEAEKEKEAANRARLLADERRRDAQRTSTRLLLERGVSLCQQHQYGPGLLWLERGLEAAPEEATDLQESLRSLMGGWGSELCRLKWVAEHSPRVLALDLSPDGKLVASGGWDGTARLWEAATGRPVGRPMPHRARVMAVKFSPDGKTLLTLCGDNTGSLWHADSGAPRGSLPQHPRRVNAAAFSPDGKHVLTGCRDGKARLWDFATGKPVGPLLPHPGPVLRVAFSPDGKFLLTACQDSTVRLWDADSGKAIGPGMRHPQEITAVAFSPDGKRVLTGCSDGMARLWEAATGKPLGQPLAQQAAIQSVAFSPDGRTLVTAGDDTTCCLWDRDSGRRLGEVLRHQGPVAAALFSPDGRNILTGSVDGTARLWEVSGISPWQEKRGHRGRILALLFSPDGRTLLTVGADRTVRLWDAATAEPRGRPMDHPGDVHAALFSPDGKTVLTRSGAVLALWDASTGKQRSSHKHRGGVTSAVFSPDSRFVLSAGADRAACLWEAGTGRLVGQPFKLANVATAAAFHPDGGLLATACLDGTAQLWRTESGQPYGQPLRHAEPIMGLSFSPNGQVLLTRSPSQLYLWDVAAGKLLGRPLSQAGILMTAVFSPDSQLVVTGSTDRTAQRVEVASGQPLGDPLPHDDAVTEVAFTPDGKAFVTRSGSAARLWRARTGEPIGPALRPGGLLQAAVFSPDSKTLLIGSDAGPVCLWDVTTSAPRGEPVVHPEGVTALAVQPDGRGFAAGGQQGSVLRWKLPPPLSGRAEDVKQELQADTGVKLDPGGATVVLDGAAWWRSWKAIKGAGDRR